MHQLHSFLRLSPAGRSLLVSAALLLLTIRVSLWLLPFQTIRRLLARLSRAAEQHATPDSASSAEHVTWAVMVASRYVPNATCLTQALAAQTLLARRGHPARLQIGVARTDEGRFVAHAWVESQGKVVIGGSSDGLMRFNALRPVGMADSRHATLT